MTNQVLLQETPELLLCFLEGRSKNRPLMGDRQGVLRGNPESPAEVLDSTGPSGRNLLGPVRSILYLFGQLQQPGLSKITGSALQS